MFGFHRFELDSKSLSRDNMSTLPVSNTPTKRKAAKVNLAKSPASDFANDSVLWLIRFIACRLIRRCQVWRPQWILGRPCLWTSHGVGGVCRGGEGEDATEGQLPRKLFPVWQWRRQRQEDLGAGSPAHPWQADRGDGVVKELFCLSAWVGLFLGQAPLGRPQGIAV